MELKEQIRRVINNDLRLQKDIAEAAGVYPATVKKIQTDPEHTVLGVTLNILEACGHTLKVAKKNDNDSVWHDLRKNPDDLPNEGDYVNVCMVCIDRTIKYYGCYYAHDIFRIINNDRIIAWREIEPFMEDNTV